MGKKSKGNRQTATTSATARQSPVASPSGSADDPTEPVERSDRIPVALHTHQTDYSGSHPARLGRYLGGLQWSPAFREWIAPVLPTTIVDERTDCWHWWTIDYVHLGVLRRFNDPREREAIAAILAWRRDGQDITEAAMRFGKHAPAWVRRMERRIAIFVRRTYGLGGVIGPEIQVWHAGTEEAQPMHTGEVAG